MTEQSLQRRVRRIVSLGEHDRCGLCLVPNGEETPKMFIV